MVDVANFSVAAKRATPKDEQVFQVLSNWIALESKEKLYDDIQRAKEDVTCLTVEQLFRKDAKAIEIGGIHLAICGFPYLCSNVFEKYPDIIGKLPNFCSAYNYQGAILMGISIDRETDIVQRDIVVYSQLSSLKTKVSSQRNFINNFLRNYCV